MAAQITVTKLDAARRQIQAAIRLIFGGGDPVAAHTLVGAASVILSDLIELKDPGKSWDAHAQAANNLAPQAYFRIMRSAQNFLKHAKDDPDGTFALSLTDTDSLAFWAVMNLGELQGPLSVPESVFQLWYLACYSPCLDDGSTISKVALEHLGDLRQLERSQQILTGARVLAECESNDV